MHKYIRNDKGGFTLVEMAIALVIIGLLVVGVFQGRELIEMSRIKSQINQINEYSVAVHTFQSKYRCYPGDCNRAEAYGLGTAGAAGKNGNGNNLVGNVIYPPQDQPWSWQENVESVNFFYHLMVSQVIKGAYTGWDSSFSAALTVAQKSSVYATMEYNPLGFLYPVTCRYNNSVSPARAGFEGCFSTYSYEVYSNGSTGVMTPESAHILDLKMDDGLPNTGIVRCLNHGGSVTGVNASPTDSCYNSVSSYPTIICNGASVNQYNITLNNKVCDLVFGKQF